jgi:hypothetical protein
LTEKRAALPVSITPAADPRGVETEMVFEPSRGQRMALSIGSLHNKPLLITGGNTNALSSDGTGPAYADEASSSDERRSFVNATMALKCKSKDEMPIAKEEPATAASWGTPEARLRA